MEKFRTFLNLLTPHVSGTFPLPDAQQRHIDFQPIYQNGYARRCGASLSNRHFWEIPLKSSTPELNRIDVIVLAARLAGSRMGSKKVGLMIYQSARNPHVVRIGLSSDQESSILEPHEIIRTWARTGSV